MRVRLKSANARFKDIPVVGLLAVMTVILSILGACSSTRALVSAPYTITVGYNSAIGNYLADSRGMTIYYNKRDSIAISTVRGDDLKIWPVFYVSDYILPFELNYGDFGALQRDDFLVQTMYRRWPLYYYSGDKLPGDILGNGFAGIWYVVNPFNFHPDFVPR
jgi:predicted lipoprotein with Yx(FWY)xxD motif